VIEVKMRLEKFRIPIVDFIFREEGEFVTKSSLDLFAGKRVVLFSLPGAFTPTCSAYQLPGFEEQYDQITSNGVDEVYCISVNDAFVMNAWGKDQNIEKVKLIPDGNAYFTRSMGQLVTKSNIGFGERSWRYAAVIDDGIIEKLFIEKMKMDNSSQDPYEETTPEKVLGYLQSLDQEELIAIREKREAMPEEKLYRV
jgi:peroxiredoxin